MRCRQGVRPLFLRYLRTSLRETVFRCKSFNCLASGACGKPADTPNHVAAWVYVICGIGIFGGMFGTLVGMFFLHKGQRDEEREKRMQYWREQVRNPSRITVCGRRTEC